MAPKKKEEMVKLHNKSKREVTLKNGVKSMPNRAVDVPSSVADFYVKEYPRDFILYEDLVAPSTTKKDLKKLKSENSKLAAEIEDLKAFIKDLEEDAEKADEEEMAKSKGAE